MTTRHIIAYTLIVLVVLATAAGILWRRHHSRERTDVRRRARQAEQYRQRDAAAAVARKSGSRADEQATE